MLQPSRYHGTWWLAFVCLLSAAAAQGACAQQSPPAWDETFKFAAAVVDEKNNTQGVTEYHYRWDIPAVSQVIANEYGDAFVILHVKTHTWRVTPGNRTCCLCTNPYACGNVLPPSPDWLRRGNETEYLGVMSINERQCRGWAKTVPPVAKFGWWVSVETGKPCQLSWLFSPASNMVMSYYTSDPARVPKEIFTIPPYCPYVETDPNCSISSF